MTNKEVGHIVRRQCVGCGTEYNDSVNQALEGGDVPPTSRCTYCNKNLV